MQNVQRTENMDSPDGQNRPILNQPVERINTILERVLETIRRKYEIRESKRTCDVD